MREVELMVLPGTNSVLDPHPAEIHGLSLSEVARVMDSAPLPVFALDHGGRFVYGNKVAEDFVGYDSAEVTGKFLSDLLVGETQSLMAGFERLKFTEYLSQGVQYKHRNGAFLDANVNNFGLTFADGARVFMSLVHRLYGGSSGERKVLDATSDAGLNSGEMRLLYLLADDFSDALIARLLGESANVVTHQVNELLNKMRVASRTEGAVLAIRKRLVL